MPVIAFVLFLIASIVIFVVFISASGLLGFFEADITVGVLWLVYRWWAKRASE